MASLLDSLAARALGRRQVVRPRLAPRFASEPLLEDRSWRALPDHGSPAPLDGRPARGAREPSGG